MTAEGNGSIKVIDSHSVHKITSGQVVIDLQTAVKELVENSLDAGATSIEVRFKDYGLKSVEVIDNGSGIAPEDYDSVGLKHHTSKLASFEDLSTVLTFGFRGEALSSLCALSEAVTVTTATASEAPMGTILELDRNGRVKSRSEKTARQRGTTVAITGLFRPLPVRRKELERNAKREFGKALNLLSAYALVPCAKENKGVRLTVSNQPEVGRKTVQLRTDGTPSTRASISSLWGPRSLENLVDLDLCFQVQTEKSVLKRRTITEGEDSGTQVRVRGLVSKFAVGCGRAATDRQFFYINGRPCNPSKVQKAFNEVYRTFNATQSPFIVADFILPTNTCDINVSPDKRTIFLHSENNLVAGLKQELEESFSPSRCTFDVNASGTLSKQATRRASDRILSDARNLDAVPDVESPLSSEDITMDSALPSSAGVSGQLASSSPVSRIQKEVAKSFVVTDTDNNEGHNLLDEGPSSSARDDVKAPMDPLDRPSPRAPSLLLDEMVASQSSSSDRGHIPRDSRLPAGVELSGSPSASQIPVSKPSRPPPQGPRTPHPREPRGLDDAPSSNVLPSRRTSATRPSSRSRADSSAPVQMILDTSGASWNLRRGSGEKERPVKRPRLDAKEGVEARENLRTRIRDFARRGSQVVPMELDEGEDDEAEEEREDRDLQPLPERESTAGVDEESHSDADRPPLLDEADEGTDVRSSTPLFLEGAEEDEEEDTPNIIVKAEAEEVVVDLTLGAVTLEREDSDAVSAPIEIIRTLNDEEVALRFDFSRVSQVWQDFRAKLTSLRSIQNSAVARNTILAAEASISNTTDNAKATDALSRVIDKQDFLDMEVIGQFNRGFIVARRVERAPGHGNVVKTDDLFIVDQHAADEKYNFETLQQTTKIEAQKLFRPEHLELTTADELLAMENIEVLRCNGFDVTVDEDALPGTGQRLKLMARPVSKGTVFDMKDLEELIDLMRDRPAGQIVRCSKARAMFAMRACRKSVMIGMPLTKSQMTTVVRHMGAIEQPWNCPHGRPTMRHLSDISSTSRRQHRSMPVDWAAFAPV